MTQQVFRLELTERERVDLAIACLAFSQDCDLVHSEETARWFRRLFDRLNALEPVGTEGGS